MTGYIKLGRNRYLEKPATFEETGIAAAIAEMEDAVTEGDLGRLMRVVSESARILVSTEDKRTYSKGEFAEYMKRTMPRIKRFSCSDIIIRAQPSSGVASCAAQTVFRSGLSKTVPRYFKFLKEGKDWFLAEAGYI